MRQQKKYNYFYKITNNINNHYYYGIHSTDNINDGYMGSGYRLQYAYKKYGIENFSKDILEYFDTREECAQHEADVVTESLVLDDNCYNIVQGGEGWNTQNLIPVLDIETNVRTSIHKTEYYKNKEKYKLLGFNFSDYIYVRYKNTNDDYFPISLDDYKNNKELYETWTSNKVTVKDKNGHMYSVSKDDPRYLSGELVFMWKDKKHTQKTKDKISAHFKEIHFHKGETNPMYNKRWVHRETENKLINISELDNYIKNGWIDGKYVEFKLNPNNPTPCELESQYNILNNWNNVAKHFNMTLSKLKHIVRKYRQYNLMK